MMDPIDKGGEDGGSDSDEFEDAIESFPVSPTPPKTPTPSKGSDGYGYADSPDDERFRNIPTLEEELASARAGMDLFFSGRIEESERLFEPLSGRCMYHALGAATFAFNRAIMTMDRDLVATAGEALKKAIAVCGRFRHRSSVTEMVWKKPKYTVREAHAELCYAECILTRAVLCFLEDETLVAFVKAGLQIRSGYYAYKECWQMLEREDLHAEPDFVSGVRLGVGAFHLMISLLPGRILRILEWVGFNGSKRFGISQLKSAFELDRSLRQPLAALVIIVYNLFSSVFFGIGDADFEFTDVVMAKMFARYPSSPFFLFFEGRRHLVNTKCQLSEAIPFYEQSWAAQKVWPQIHHACFWELMWCFMYQCEWEKAAEFAERLLKSSKWSPATFAYFRAANLSMKQDLSANEKQEVEGLVSRIPPWKQRIAGKSIPIEKFAVQKSEIFFRQGKCLVLPGLELLYLWNGFVLIGGRREPAERIMRIVDETLSSLRSKESEAAVLEREDNLALCLALKGCCLKSLGQPEEALVLFQEVLSLKTQIRDDLYLLPYVTAEIGLLHLGQGKRDLAKEKLKEAIQSYKGYALESRLHFRIHAALKKIYRIESENKD